MSAIAGEHRREIYVGGHWRRSDADGEIEVRNPATEEVIGYVPAGKARDVDLAVGAATKAFAAWSETSREERLRLLASILDEYNRSAEELAQAVTAEMGSPITLSRTNQVPKGADQLRDVARALRDYSFEVDDGTTRILREPIGVCGLITPWNWPLHQVLCKVAPALAAGCTMVLKPSEISPFSANLLTEIMERAGMPPGVFNLVHGRGLESGSALAAHAGVDLVSFTGSTRAGIDVAQKAAATVKRVCQELGGKSPNVILDDADLEQAVRVGVAACYVNGGQTCSAMTRMLVPAPLHERAAEIAAAAAGKFVVGDPLDPATEIGPLASQAQFSRVQQLIAEGVAEGAELRTGGPERPDGLEFGWFVRPTVFSGVHNSMKIARTEIFGPVLTIIPYETEQEAIEIANDTDYGLAAMVWGESDRARSVARRLRAGHVRLNGAANRTDMPFGGYKQSGNGREQGVFGLEEYLEVKAVLGFSG